MPLLFYHELLVVVSYALASIKTIDPAFCRGDGSAFQFPLAFALLARLLSIGAQERDQLCKKRVSSFIAERFGRVQVDSPTCGQQGTHENYQKTAQQDQCHQPSWEWEAHVKGAGDPVGEKGGQDAA